MKNEIAILSSMDHPNIVKYIVSYEDKEELFIVMENVLGAIELKEHIDKLYAERQDETQPIMSEYKAAELMYMFAKGIHHIHTHGIVHRDVKPANCLIDSDGVLKIIDFGFAVTRTRDEFLMKAQVGTDLFVAPEIIESSGLWDAYTPACDIYALGVSLFRMLSGVFPFKETDVEELEFEKLRGNILFVQPCW